MRIKDTGRIDATGSIIRSDFRVNYAIPVIGEVLDLEVEFEAVKR